MTHIELMDWAAYFDQNPTERDCTERMEKTLASGMARQFGGKVTDHLILSAEQRQEIYWQDFEDKAQ